MQIKNLTKILGLGAVVACGVCLVPLAIPLIAGAGGIGLISGGYLVAGVLVLGLAGVLWLRRHRKRCECC